MSSLERFIVDDLGATAVEYGLIAALVSVAGIAGLTALGGSLNTIFSFIASTLASAAAATPAP